MMKVCSKCGAEKPLGVFAKAGKRTRSVCKQCWASYIRESSLRRVIQYLEVAETAFLGRARDL